MSFFEDLARRFSVESITDRIRAADRKRRADATERHAPSFPPPAVAPGEEWLDGARRRMVDAAVSLWAKSIREKSRAGREFMHSAIATDDGIGWHWIDVDSRPFEWCGATAAYLQRQANGLHITDRYPHWSSCFRLHSRRPATLGRDYRVGRGATAQPGDVVIVGPANGNRWGQHITTVIAVDGRGAWCIGGNQTGLHPDGSRRHGVALTLYRWERRRPSSLAVMHRVPVLEAGCDASAATPQPAADMGLMRRVIG